MHNNYDDANDDTQLQMSEMTSTNFLTSGERCWEKRRSNGIKKGTWCDKKPVQFDYWNDCSPYKEYEEISQLIRSNLFPGYSHSTTKYSLYDDDYNSDVVHKRCETEAHEEFKRRTKWRQKAIEERTLQKKINEIQNRKNNRNNNKKADKNEDLSLNNRNKNK
ncbi:hypothetical protein HELRODRAFT_178886 [Helobdella robusta]|uniref:Uncharacterized protein n=1 Tax=Helobdella robusta TaxID=6412 RepID=T1FDV0_HELRO|nr:hypothetical protein HELRODRAFT_178886 [Helobdella robusta]ESN95968.1 hypothetical protein HELRODRAFT_178886 [Helobdella robusta]